MHISLGRAALVLAALTATATADELAPPGTTAPSPLSVADAPPPAPVRGPRLQLALTGDLRLTHLDGAAGRFVDDAMAYGWRIAPVLPATAQALDGWLGAGVAERDARWPDAAAFGRDLPALTPTASTPLFPRIDAARTAGVMLAVAYTLTDHPAVDGPAPPVGGLDLAIGPYLRR